MKPRRRIAIGAALVAVGLAVAGCAGGAESEEPDTPSVGANEFGLPDSVAESGVLRIGATFGYPPWSQHDGENLEGIDVTLVEAVAERLGLKAEFENFAPENVFPAVQNGRADVHLGAFTLKTDGYDETTYLSIYHTELRLVVREGNPHDVDPADLCGAVAGVTSGYTAQRFVEDRSAECVEAGKEPIEILTFTDAAGQFLALTNGQSEFGLQDSQVAKHVVSQNPDLEVIDEQIAGDSPGDNGWILSPSEDGQQLAEAIAKAVNSLAEDGTWEEVFEETGLAGMEILPPWVNGEPVED